MKLARHVPGKLWKIESAKLERPLKLQRQKPVKQRLRRPDSMVLCSNLKTTVQLKLPRQQSKKGLSEID